MALFLEYSDKVKNRKYPITKPVRQHASALYNALEKLVPKNNLKGLKDLATLKKYNVKGANSDKNGENTNIKYITTDDAIKRLQRKGYGVGDAFIQNFLKRCVDKSTSQEEVSPVEPPKPTSNEVKPPQVKTKTINGSNGTVTYTENRVIKEGIENNVFYDYLEEYDVNYVFQSFMENPKGKQSWTPLINPDMYAKALREFTQYGKLVKFPAKYVYQWMGIILKNTAILCSNTDIARHSSHFPYEEYEEFLKTYFKNREVDVDQRKTKIEISQQEVMELCDEENIFMLEAVDKYGQTYFPWVSQDDADRMVAQQEMEKTRARFNEMYGEILPYVEKYNNENHREKIELDPNSGKIFWVADEFDVLYRIGFDDWMMMPDGTDAFSDFGIDPLLKILAEYNEDLPPEKVLVLVNRALDVYHMRGDLSSIFVVGGSNALSRIAEEIEFSKGKKIYLSEQALKKLYEYYTQLNLPFNDTTGKGYDDKQNYEHFIDWMEYVGKYGTLPSSNINEQELSSIIEANIPNAFKNYLDSDLEDYNYLDGLSSAIKYVYSMCEDGDDLRIFFNMPEEFYEDPPYDIIEFIEENDIDRDDIDELRKLLTDEGVEEFNKYMREYFVDTYTDNGIPNSLTFDNRGLIYVEREITTPNVLSTNMPENMDMKNYFEYLRSSFNGLGNCWTWKQGHGEAYCGNGYGNNDYILLQGWVDPKSINWEETLVRNAWSLNDEAEIFINDGQIVEVDKVTINNASNGNYGKNILNRPMLIQT